MQRVSSLEITFKRITLVLDDQSHEDWVSFQASYVQGSLKHFVSRINFGAFIQQVFNELWVATLHSIMKTSLFVDLVNFTHHLILLAFPLTQVLHDSTRVATLA